jgi:hypothetical protein
MYTFGISNTVLNATNNKATLPTMLRSRYKNNGPLKPVAFKKTNFYVSATFVILLCGCGVVPPKISYGEYDISEKAFSSSNNSPKYPFRQRRSVLLLRSSDDSPQKLTVVAAPSEFGQDNKYSSLYFIQGMDDFKSTTQLKISYIDNTKFIDELQITTKDNIADTISKVGALTKAIIPLAATFVSGTADTVAASIKPTIIDPATITENKWEQDPVNPNICVRLRETVVESPMTMAEYLKTNNSHQSFPIPACTTAVLDVALVTTGSNCDTGAISTANVTTTRATYAHYTNVIPMPVPSSGSLKMHPICGTSITEASTQDRYQLLTYLTSIATQAKEAQSAWQEAKKSKEKK